MDGKISEYNEMTQRSMQFYVWQNNKQNKLWE